MRQALSKGWIHPKRYCLVQMGCCIGAEVEVKHVAPMNAPMAICTCGRTLAVRKEAAHLWVRVAAD